MIRQKKDQAERLLDFMITSVPEMEPPPFFAPRVSHLAEVRSAPIAASMLTWARRLLPALAGVSLFAVVLTFQLSPISDSEFPAYTEFLVGLENGTSAQPPETLLDFLGPE